MKDLLFKLIETKGAAGDEKNILDVIKKELKKHTEEIEQDICGNLKISFGKKNANFHLLLEAHVDQIGMIITDILEGGFLKIASCGGIDPRILPGSVVKVHGTKELSGIICTVPPHVENEKQEKYKPISELFVDMGKEKEELLKYISIGDRISYYSPVTNLLNGKIAGSALDNRVSVAILLNLAKKIAKINPQIRTTMLFSVQEEVSGLGSRVGAFGINVDEAIVLDVSFAEQPEIEKTNKGSLGGGAMIGYAPILSKEIYENLITLAKKNNIKYTTEIMANKTGTNADEIASSNNGIKTGLISIPLRYMHAPFEVVNPKDIEEVSKLLEYYIKEKR